MELEKMKFEYALAQLDYKNVMSRTARLGISEQLRKLKDKIDDEERRLNSKLRVVDIDGVNYEVPTGFYQENDRYTYEVRDGCLYRFEKMKLDSDGSFHLHHHVWIPQTETKFVDLCVRVLGNDIYGDRYYLSASYYKHPSDTFPYMHKDISTNNYGYKPYYDYILNKMGYLYKKDNWKTNLLVRNI